MAPNEKNLEKLIKKIVKQQTVPAGELLIQWHAVGDRGDRTVIHTLNRRNGWEAFLFWSESKPEIRSALQHLSNRAGISEAGVLVLKAAGFATVEDSDRSQALWILHVVRQGPNENWNRAASLMLQGEDFFEGTHLLLEMEETQETAEFLTHLLELDVSRDQDQEIRKSLYRLRQKGIAVSEKVQAPRFSVAPERSEIFLLAENRLPMWQPFFYHSSHGARGDWFFSEISEGKKFEIVQQQRNVRMNQKQMQRIADNYAAHFEQGTGVKMRFDAVPSEHARYFVETSFDLLQGADEFRNYMGAGKRSNPLEQMDVAADLQASHAVALLELDYFILWMVEDDFLKEFSSKLKDIESGPIILPEQQQREQKSKALNQALQDYFNPAARRVWGLALQKAAYSLRNSDPDSSKIAAGFARMISNQEQNIVSDPFAVALLERSMQIYGRQQEKRQAEEKKTSLIMSPQEFERSLKKS